MKINNKGLTLIEMIVGIAIGAIVLTIVGSLIVSSFRFVYATTNVDIDKRVVDSIIDVVRTDIKYAYKVKIMKFEDSLNDRDIKEQPGWHCYFVNEEGLLCKDQADNPVFHQGFYNGKTLKILAQGHYDNQVRVDMSYELYDENQEKTYSAKDTLMFLNTQFDKEITSESLYQGTGHYLDNNSYDDLHNQGGYALYFNNQYIEHDSSHENHSHEKGTVADIIHNISGENYRGVFDPQQQYEYMKGEIVWYEGYWWERLAYTDQTIPGHAFGWKRLTAHYTAPQLEAPQNAYSSYEKGDIVIYQGKYFQAQCDIYHHDGTSNQGFITDARCWALLGFQDDEDIQEKVEQNKYEKKKLYPHNVITKYLPDALGLNDPSKKTYASYDASHIYHDGDIVKVLNPQDSTFYDLWIKKSQFESALPPGIAQSGWVKIDMAWDARSAYMKGDIVRYIDGENQWIEAVQDIIKENDPQYEMNNQGIWKRMEKRGVIYENTAYR